MTDLLVNLRKLSFAPTEVKGVVVRRLGMEELSSLKKFIIENFDDSWWMEIRNGLRSYNRVSVFAAFEGSVIVGFGAYEVTNKGYFGPLGVATTSAGKGIGKALLTECLLGLNDLGYTYGVIHNVGDSIGFYQKTLGKNVQEIEI